MSDFTVYFYSEEENYENYKKSNDHVNYVIYESDETEFDIDNIMLKFYFGVVQDEQADIRNTLENVYLYFTNASNIIYSGHINKKDEIIDWYDTSKVDSE